MKIIITLLILIFIPCVSGAKNLYVATSGNDSVSYANNDIDHPWITVSKAFSGALPGDTVYFRSGSYPVDTRIYTKDLAKPTQESERITFRNYPAESVYWTSNIAISQSEVGVISIDYSYITIKGIDFSSDLTFFGVAFNANVQYFIMEYCTGHVNASLSGPNIGAVYFRAQSIDVPANPIIRNNTFSGPGYTANLNTAGVYLFRTQGAKVYNNEFYSLPNAIYFKHTCVGRDTGTEVYNNFGYDLFNGLLWVGQYANIYNNVFYSHANGAYFGLDGGPGDDGTNIGGGYNTLTHNTFLIANRHYGDGDEGPIKIGWYGNGDYPINNVFRDNIFTGGGNTYSYYETFFDPILTEDYNVYSGPFYYHRTTYTLPQWISYYGQDAHSLSGTPTFSGGVLPTTIPGFSLASGSVGYGSSSSGSDVGANVSTVGVQTEYGSPTITSQDDFSTTSSSVEINGSYTNDPDLPDQAVTVTWTLGESSGFCAAALGVFSCTVPVELGANSVVFEITDSNSGTDSDTAVVTRTAPPSGASVGVTLRGVQWNQ